MIASGQAGISFSREHSLQAVSIAAIGEAILDTMKALLIFLDRDSLEQVPLLLASQLGVFPTELDRNVCEYVLQKFQKGFFRSSIC